MERGVVTQYDEERGFGFVRSSAYGDKDVFVHASTVQGGCALKPGQRVRFTAEVSSKGPRATRVEPGRRGLSPAMVSALALGLVVVVGAVALGSYAGWSPLWAVLGAINLATFLVYGIDKKRAMTNRRRVPERVLLGLALVGGSPAAAAAMSTFRHKTRKAAFLIPFIVIVAAQVAGIAWWLQKSGMDRP